MYYKKMKNVTKKTPQNKWVEMWDNLFLLHLCFIHLPLTSNFY